MANAQLSQKEAVKVYVERDTGRILGFSPEGANLLTLPGGHIRYNTHLLQHASDIERWVAKYRIQQERDAYEGTLRQIQREGVFRKSLASAIRSRNNVVNQFNRDLNNTFIRLMDERYDQIMKRRLKVELHGVAEAYEEGTTAAEIAMSGPYSQPSGIERASGEAVDMRANVQKMQQAVYESRFGRDVK